MVTESVTSDEKRKCLSKTESYLLSYLTENRKNIVALSDIVNILYLVILAHQKNKKLE
jgi:DNA-binding winged helix-turn-helix (wHTH) protein